MRKDGGTKLSLQTHPYILRFTFYVLTNRANQNFPLPNNLFELTSFHGLGFELRSS
jgi:hypothetical protein